MKILLRYDIINYVFNGSIQSEQLLQMLNTQYPVGQFTCLKLTMETLEQGVKCVQS